ncbi:MAG: TrmH family RNA methyltransferase, partial [Firmicutes bacterium]|nr:TrmH family RNA methyltransferase [Bacillota bacterium]
VINSFIYSYEKKLSNWALDTLGKTPTKINYELPSKLLDDLSGKTDASELIAIVQMQPDDVSLFTLSKNPILALFDRPSNRGNLGTIIRSLDSFGIEGLVITGHGVDLYDPETIVASMGSFFNVPVVRMNDNKSIELWLANLKGKYPNLKVVGTSAHASKCIYELDLTSPILFLIGNETDGLANKLLETSDVIAKIPMANSSSASSFNVACATSIVFYEAIRQRQGDKSKG